MSIIIHDFTKTIIAVLDRCFGGQGLEILERSQMIQYLNIKTKAANRGSKSRSGFANHYAIYVLIEDYLNGGFDTNGGYAGYGGALFSNLLRRQRALPFGSKLQNHALNHRLNQEFKRYFPMVEHVPIVRDVKSGRYWINEQLIVVELDGHAINLAAAIKEIIENYIQVKQKSFLDFIGYCKAIIKIQDKSPQESVDFVKGLFAPSVDARIFEIVSFAILKQHYAGQKIYWGWDAENLNEDCLILYKTGRTNANDGGIDFVMKPLGRFFQVTETVEAGKYFLDIDKVQRYPVTFVVKTAESNEEILQKISNQAHKKYNIKAVVDKYMESIEEIINIPRLISIYEEIVQSGNGAKVIEDIILHSKIEFNIESDE